MASSDVLSNRTKSGIPSGSESTTTKDMVALYEWEVGDAEPEGTHARSFAPHRRLRRDLRRGISQAKSYKHNVIWVNTFKPIADQLYKLG